MKKVTDAGLIISSLIIASGMMFSADKELTAWLFVLIAASLFVKFIKFIEEPKVVTPLPPVAGHQPHPQALPPSPPPTVP